MSSRVAPFGNPRINGYLLLPEAFRSLSRPSSAPDAKAFPLRSFQLDLLVAKSARLRFRFSAKTPPAPLLLASNPNPLRWALGWSWGRESRFLLRVVREFLVLFENYAGLNKDRNCMLPCILSNAVPQSIFLPCVSTWRLSVALLYTSSHCSVFKVQVRRKKLLFARFASQQSSHRSVLSPLPFSNASLV